MKQHVNPFKWAMVTLSVCVSTHTFAQDLPASTRKLYDEVMHYVKNLSKDKDFTPTVPPTTYYDYCFPCDQKRQAQFAKDSIKFMDEYMGEENTQMKKVAQVTKEATAFEDIEHDMMMASITIAQRMQAKLAAAWKIYGTDPGKIPFLVSRMLEQDRFNGLRSVSSDAMPPVGELLLARVESAIRILQKAKAEHDYPILLNTPLINDAFRSAALIDMKLDDNIIDYLNQARFQFTIETKAKVQGTDGTTFSASLSNKSFFKTRPNDKCQLEWTMIEPGGDKMIYELKDIAMRIPKPEQPVYNGGREYISNPPEMKFDFCDESRDLVHMYGFYQRSGVVENWTWKGRPLPGTVVLHAYVICFPDTKQYTDYQKGGALPSPVAYGFYIKAQPKNKSLVILEKTLDASQTTMAPQNVVYGDFKIKIEHAPKD